MKPFWTYDRQAKEFLTRHDTAKQASSAAKRHSNIRPGHEIAWGPRKDKPKQMLGYWKSRVMPEFEHLK